MTTREEQLLAIRPVISSIKISDDMSLKSAFKI